MTKRIEVILTDEIADLLEGTLIGEGNLNRFATFLLLQGLSAYFQSHDDDENAKKIEAFIERVEN